MDRIPPYAELPGFAGFVRTCPTIKKNTVKEKKQAQERDKKALADYKKIGNTFVPPRVPG